MKGSCDAAWMTTHCQPAARLNKTAKCGRNQKGEAMHVRNKVTVRNQIKTGKTHKHTHTHAVWLTVSLLTANYLSVCFSSANQGPADSPSASLGEVEFVEIHSPLLVALSITAACRGLFNVQLQNRSLSWVNRTSHPELSDCMDMTSVCNHFL